MTYTPTQDQLAARQAISDAADTIAQALLDTHSAYQILSNGPTGDNDWDESFSSMDGDQEAPGFFVEPVLMNLRSAVAGLRYAMDQTEARDA